MNIVLCVIALSSSQFLRLSPGVLSQGLGGASVVINEGLSIFHNPAYNQDREFNFTLSRWLYSTNHLTIGGTYGEYIFGVTYMNYGRIQGYDDLGNPTAVFTPYDMCVGFGRRFGPIGIGIKAFNEQIHDQTLYGVCASAGLYIQSERIALGIKVDNLGKEFAQSTTIPVVIAGGLRYGLIRDFDILAEAKYPGLEANMGFIYAYHDLRIFLGTKFSAPVGQVAGGELNLSRDDLYLSGGILVRIDAYDIGYSIVYGSLSVAHQFSVTITP
jgi:hypothetical protein